MPIPGEQVVCGHGPASPQAGRGQQSQVLMGSGQDARTVGTDPCVDTPVTVRRLRVPGRV